MAENAPGSTYAAQAAYPPAAGPGAAYGAGYQYPGYAQQPYAPQPGYTDPYAQQQATAGYGYPGYNYDYNAYYQQQQQQPYTAAPGQPPLPPSDASSQQPTAPAPPADNSATAAPAPPPPDTNPPLPSASSAPTAAPAQGYYGYYQQPATGYYAQPAQGYSQQPNYQTGQQQYSATQPPGAAAQSQQPAARAPQTAAPAAAAPPAGAPPSHTFKPTGSGANALPLGSRRAGTNQAPLSITIKPNMPRKPAFVSAAAPPKQAAAAPSSKPQGGSQQGWPPSLKAFVQRYFERRSGSLTDAHKAALKRLIQDADSKGELWTRDWDSTPLPRLEDEGPHASGPAAAAAAAGRAGFKARWGPPVTGGAAARGPAAAAAVRQQQHQQYGAAGKRAREAAARLAAAKGFGGAKRGKWAQQHQQQPSSSSSDEEGGSPIDARERARRQRRAGRFGNGTTPALGKGAPSANVGPSAAGRARQRLLASLAEAEADEVDWDLCVIKGTCTQLEKSYFRLTSAPDPSTVRPEPVLWRAYHRLVGMLAEQGGAANYFYALDQFKGMRQDLTVQHLRNTLTVAVYEGHARSALEYGDTAEFNQCQTQLDALYKQQRLQQQGAGGSSGKAAGSKGGGAAAGSRVGAQLEFLAYRILYQTVHARHGESAALLKTLKSLTPEDCTAPAVAHALDVRRAVAMCDYVRFFRLYRACPGLGRCLMDLAVARMRHSGAEALAKACGTGARPTLPVPYLARVLGFYSPGGSSGGDAAVAAGQEVLPGCMHMAKECGKNNPTDDEDEALEDCLAWLTASNGVVTGSDPASCVLDCKQSAGQMVIPEDTSAVAHGDANLNIDDFLSRTVG